LINKIRIVIVDDHHVVRTAIATLVSQEKDIEVVGEISDPRRILETINLLKPDILLLDAHMPGHRVIDTVHTLCLKHPEMPILILSAYNRREYVLGLLKAGVTGYVLKNDSPDMLLDAIRSVAHGQEWLSPQLAKIVMGTVRNNHAPKATPLTKREQEVLRLMACGHKNGEIAEELAVTTQTVKNHVTSIYSKLGAESRVEAVLYAVNHELIAVPENDQNPVI